MTAQKSFLGLDKLYYALVTADTIDAYTVGTPNVLAPLASLNIEPSTNNKIQYFDNIPMESLNSEGASKLSLEIQGMSLATYAELMGKVYDAVNGKMFDSGATAPYVALGFRAKLTDGGYRYYWFLKGNFAEPKEELVTQSESPDPKVLKLEYSALRTTYQFVQSGSLTDSSKYVKADTSNAAFTEAATWFDAVKVPVAGSPSAITCTPSPADGATGVSAAIVPTLTFNNALVTETAGILLTKNDGVIVAATITIDAAKKVITITPGGSLTSAAKYLITVAGARDIYGQLLSSKVYDFTIA